MYLGAAEPTKKCNSRSCIHETPEPHTGTVTITYYDTTYLPRSDIARD